MIQKKQKAKKDKIKIPTKELMESFQNYCEKIRKIKPIFIRFKDGKLIKNALNHISKFQMEMLFVWFLENKKNMQPTIGSALCKEVISDFINSSHKEYGFYNKLERAVNFYKMNQEKKEEEKDKMAEAIQKLREDLYKKVRPFNYKTQTQIIEEVAIKERKNTLI